MNLDWKLRRVPLKFRIGDWTAFSVGLQLHTCSVRLTDRADPDPATKPPPGQSLGTAAGYMIRALPVSAALPTLSVCDGYIRYVTLQYDHCYIDLSIGLERYRESFSAKTRSTILRKIRKFQEFCGGELKLSSYQSAGSMAEFHRLAREVSVKTYQERLLDAGIPWDTEFTQEIVRLAERDQVRGYILFHNDKPVSYLYCPAQEGALVYAYLGYDPEYMKQSVGTVLQWLALEQIFAEGRFAFFDFTEGQGDHKRLFATHEVRCANVMFLKRTLWLRLLVAAHAWTDSMSSGAGALAARWGVKARLKRMLRFGVASPR